MVNNEVPLANTPTDACVSAHMVRAGRSLSASPISLELRFLAEFFLRVSIFLGGLQFRGVRSNISLSSSDFFPLMSPKKGTLLAFKVPFQEAPRLPKHIIICLHTIPSRIRPQGAILQVKKQAQNGSRNSARTQRDSQDRRWALSPLVLLWGGSDPGRLAPWRSSVTRGDHILAPSSRNTELCSLLRTAVCKPGQTSCPLFLHPCSPRLGTGPINGAVQVAASGIPLVGPQLRLHISTAGSMGSVPGRRTKILHAAWYGQRREKREKENIPFRQE